jgi:hypothetical protein
MYRRRRPDLISLAEVARLLRGSANRFATRLRACPIASAHRWALPVRGGSRQRPLVPRQQHAVSRLQGRPVRSWHFPKSSRLQPFHCNQQQSISATRYFLSNADRPGGGSPKNSEVSDRGAADRGRTSSFTRPTKDHCSVFVGRRCTLSVIAMLGALASVTCRVDPLRTGTSPRRRKTSALCSR